MTEEERNQVLSAVFPTRTITGALALLEAAGKTGTGCINPSSTTRRATRTARGTRWKADWAVACAGWKPPGTFWKPRWARSFPARWRALRITDFINAINGLDDARFSMLVSGLEGIAVAGPALITAGGALKLISSLGAGGGIALAAVALLAFGAAVSSLNESIYADKFGDLELDKDGIGQYLKAWARRSRRRKRTSANTTRRSKRRSATIPRQAEPSRNRF
ncbi:MAG: hypothetical protein ACLUI3_00230 [Christensenellales bacterium]